MFNINLLPGQIKSVAVNPLDDNGNGGTYDGSTILTFSSSGPIAFAQGSILQNVVFHLVLQAQNTAAPGVYNATGTFKAVSGGPDINTPFTVTILPQLATHLGFTEI